MPRPEREAEIAANFLSDKVLELTELGQAQVPPLRELAFEAGVSLGTMVKAVTALKAGNTLVSVPGRGVFIRGLLWRSGEPRRLPDCHRAYRWHTVRAQLEKDIAEGAICPDGVLLSRKELAHRYGVNARTLRRALEEAVADGRLVAHRRSLRVAHHVSPRPHNEVVLFTRNSPATENARLRDSTAYLESRCTRMNLRLRTIFYGYEQQNLVVTSPDEDNPLGRVEGAVGAVVMLEGLGDLNTNEIARACGRHGIPLALMEASGSFPSCLHARAPCDIRGFALPESAVAGRQAAQLLADLGHRTVVYVSPFHDTAWSRQRLEGLRAAFARMGRPGGMHAVTCVTPALPGGGGGLDRLTELRRRVIEQGVDWNDPYERLFGRAVMTLITPISSAMRSLQLSQRIRPLFESALGQRTGATAWVCANDTTALECLRFLREHGLDVPEDFSVLGFDNTFESYHAGLTSYSFNESAALDAAVDYLLMPTATRARQPNGQVFRVQGHVVARRSTAGRV